MQELKEQAAVFFPVASQTFDLMQVLFHLDRKWPVNVHEPV